MDTILTVAQLNNIARELLEVSFPAIWIEGEISNFKLHPPSGHMYFSLKDESAQIRCAMFKMQNRHLDFKPADGSHVLMRAKVTLYEARGEYQLIADYMEQSGIGQLLRQFELLKEKLASQGLFSPEHKRPLPSFPKTIGIITSPSGAAIKDILMTLRRRFPSIKVIIYPTLVQGSEAPQQICQAIHLANTRKECDILILARGGGSLEDLWAFNDEALAHAIYHSKIPTITGIGHEPDFTIADFVADHRASTPTAAAELCTPDAFALSAKITLFESRLISLITRYLQDKSQHVDHLQKRLINPRERLLLQKERLQNLYHKLIQYNEASISKKKQRLSLLCQALNTLSPLATLSRGYALVSNLQNEIIKDSQQVNPGDTVKVKLAKGALSCRVL